MPAGRITLRVGERDQAVDVVETPEGTVVRIEGEAFNVTAEDHRIRVEGAPGGMAWVVSAGDLRWVYYDGCVYELEQQRDGRRRTSRHQGSLSAPMPATVRQIRVGVGDAVRRGDTLIVLEAMKMELPIKSPRSGIVKAVHCAKGDLVQPGVNLLEIE
jgi:biotin carboxyl carrier protein